jgi:hypothetical protein
MSDTAGWLAENGVGTPTDYPAYGGLLARRQAEQAEQAEERADERRLAELEESRDQRLTAMYLAGVQPGATVARAQALQDLETEMATHQAEVDRLARRRDRLVAEGRDAAELASRAAAMVEGPAADRGGVEGALQRARVAAREMRAEARVEARVASRPVSRPKGRGSAVRSDGGDVCADCLSMGATEQESFAIHHPELLPAMGEEPATVPDDSKRSARRDAEIQRLLDAGYSLPVAQYASAPAGAAR